MASLLHSGYISRLRRAWLRSADAAWCDVSGAIPQDLLSLEQAVDEWRTCNAIMNEHEASIDAVDVEVDGDDNSNSKSLHLQLHYKGFG